MKIHWKKKDFTKLSHFVFATNTDKIYQKENRTDVIPTNSPENSWTVTDHLLNIWWKPVHSIYPTHTSSFNENYEKNRQTGTINVQQIHQINATLE